MSIAMDIFVMPFHSRCGFTLCCQLRLVLVVMSGPFMLGKFAWMSPFEKFQTIFPILLQWLMPWFFSWYCIPHVLAYLLVSLLLLVCWILGQEKISICSAACLWFWDVWCIWIYMKDHSTSSVLCCFFWMWHAVI